MIFLNRSVRKQWQLKSINWMFIKSNGPCKAWYVSSGKTNKLNKAQTRSAWMRKQMQNTTLRQNHWSIKHQNENTTGKIIDYKLLVREAMIETKNIEATLAINYYYKGPYNVRSKNTIRCSLRDFSPSNSPCYCFGSGTLPHSNRIHIQGAFIAFIPPKGNASILISNWT